MIVDIQANSAMRKQNTKSIELFDYGFGNPVEANVLDWICPLNL